MNKNYDAQKVMTSRQFQRYTYYRQTAMLILTIVMIAIPTLLVLFLRNDANRWENAGIVLACSVFAISVSALLVYFRIFLLKSFTPIFGSGLLAVVLTLVINEQTQYIAIAMIAVVLFTLVVSYLVSKYSEKITSKLAKSNIVVRDDYTEDIQYFNKQVEQGNFDAPMQSDDQETDDSMIEDESEDVENDDATIDGTTSETNETSSKKNKSKSKKKNRNKRK